MNQPPERVRGHADPPLTRQGHEEAREEAKELASFRPVVIFSGQDSRTQQTAHAIARRTSARIIPLTGLNAWDIGSLSGQRKSQVTDQITHLVAHATERPPGGGESYQTFHTRVHTGMAHVLAGAEKHNAHVVVVTHDSVIRALTGETMDPGDHVVFTREKDGWRWHRHLS